MYKKKIPFDIDCGIKITMEVIGGKRKQVKHCFRLSNRWRGGETVSARR
ncbi:MULTISPECIES: hypothetical protein [Parabacteroides]|nr:MULTISPECIES: hypothetical protein [Parabacteroides]WFE87210.1 hypothetical protein P3L47_18245 [Parabacteroides chongii]